jgi:glycosyltransferase involved in cell wall biosynthesis
LAIVPLRYGAGVKGKVVEALYYGMPVITTATGAEGLEESDEILTIADGAEDFAGKIIGLYNDFESMREFSRKSRDYVKNRFTKESALKAIYTDIYK